MKCFLHNKKFSKQCEKKDCRYWMKSSKCQNCCLIGSENLDLKSITLQDVGEIFGVTRMRICQIEKLAIKKITEKLKRI